MRRSSSARTAGTGVDSAWLSPPRANAPAMHASAWQM
jgi:hypothetical protein